MSAPPLPDRAVPARELTPLLLLVLMVGATAIAFAPILAVLASRYDNLDPVVTAFWRTALSVPVLGLLWLVSPARTRPALREPAPLGLLLPPGAFFAIDLGCWHVAMTHISAGLATLLSNLSVVVVPVLAWVALGERYDRRHLPATSLALVGAALVANPPGSAVVATLGLSGDRYWLGNALAGSTAIAYAAYQLCVQRARRHFGVLAVTCAASATSALLLVSFCLASGSRLLPNDERAWAALVGLAIVSHCLGQGLIAWCLGRLPAHVVALVLLWQPVCATLLSVWVLGQGIGPLQVLGTVVVVLGLGLLISTRHRRPAL